MGVVKEETAMGEFSIKNSRTRDRVHAVSGSV